MCSTGGPRDTRCLLYADSEIHGPNDNSACSHYGELNDSCFNPYWEAIIVSSCILSKLVFSPRWGEMILFVWWADLSPMIALMRWSSNSRSHDEIMMRSDFGVSKNIFPTATYDNCFLGVQWANPAVSHGDLTSNSTTQSTTKTGNYTRNRPILMPLIKCYSTPLQPTLYFQNPQTSDTTSAITTTQKLSDLYGANSSTTVHHKRQTHSPQYGANKIRTRDGSYLVDGSCCILS